MSRFCDKCKQHRHPEALVTIFNDAGRIYEICNGSCSSKFFQIMKLWLREPHKEGDTRVKLKTVELKKAMEEYKGSFY